DAVGARYEEVFAGVPGQLAALDWLREPADRGHRPVVGTWRTGAHRWADTGRPREPGRARTAGRASGVRCHGPSR
ncbi:hypothetical protein AB0E11_26320, partial [Streptomyces fradiae]